MADANCATRARNERAQHTPDTCSRAEHIRERALNTQHNLATIVNLPISFSWIGSLQQQHCRRQFSLLDQQRERSYTLRQLITSFFVIHPYQPINQPTNPSNARMPQRPKASGKPTNQPIERSNAPTPESLCPTFDGALGASVTAVASPFPTPIAPLAVAPRILNAATARSLAL